MQGWLLGIDQSTQGTKALLLGEDGTILASAALPHRQIISRTGWVSHDLNEIYKNVLSVSRKVISSAGVLPAQIIGVALTNQRETTAAWDLSGGHPLSEAVVWQCSRAAEICHEIENGSMNDEGSASTKASLSLQDISRKTGLELSPYYSAAKMAWLLRQVAVIKGAAEKGILALGTIDAYLVYRLSGGTVFATDTSNASRTQLFDLQKLDWDDSLLSLFDIPRAALPEIRAADEGFGQTDLEGILPGPVPILASLGDSHAALFGHGCTEPGDIKVTYGTGSSIVLQTGDTIIRSKSGLSTSVAWTQGGQTKYVLEGNVHYAGAVINWLKSDVSLIKDEAEIEELCRKASSEDRTYLVPAFTGLGAPWWASHARASLSGMGRLTGRAEIIRAAVECIAYQILDVIKVMRTETGLPVSCIHADGGPTANGYLMQFQSDVLNAEIKMSAVTDQSAMGTALLAGLKAGLWSIKEIRQIVTTAAIYNPSMAEEERNERLSRWESAVQKVLLQ